MLQLECLLQKRQCRWRGGVHVKPYMTEETERTAAFHLAFIRQGEGIEAGSPWHAHRNLRFSPALSSTCARLPLPMLAAGWGSNATPLLLNPKPNASLQACEPHCTTPFRRDWRMPLCDASRRAGRSGIFQPFFFF